MLKNLSFISRAFGRPLLTRHAQIKVCIEINDAYSGLSRVEQPCQPRETAPGRLMPSAHYQQAANGRQSRCNSRSQFILTLLKCITFDLNSAEIRH